MVYPSNLNSNNIQIRNENNNNSDSTSVQNNFTSIAKSLIHTNNSNKYKNYNSKINSNGIKIKNIPCNYKKISQFTRSSITTTKKVFINIMKILIVPIPVHTVIKLQN